VNATRSLLVGVDVGSTMIKAGVVSVEGDELGHVLVPTGWRQVPTGAEVEPTALLHAVQAALAGMLAAAPPGDITAVGVTSMAETAILLDGDGGAIGPAVAWYDTRAADDYAQMALDLSPDEIGHHTGLTPAQIPTVATLRWLMRNHPELRRARQVLSVAEWVIYGLGGSIGAELSLASRTGALSITSRRWWDDSLQWAGLGSEIFPDLHPAGASWGRIVKAPDGLERLGGATLSVAGHDHLTASVGSGVTTSSQLMNSCGTAEALIRPVAADTTIDPGAGISRGIATGWHALPEHYALLGAGRLGIDLIPLLERLGATAEHGRTDLDAPVLAVLDGAVSIEDCEPGPLEWKAALEGAVQRTAHRLSQLEDLGGRITEVRVGGGWATNPVLERLKAGVLPNPVYPQVAEAGIRGAALLAGLAAGVYPSVDAFPPPALNDPDDVRDRAAQGSG
jgi:sugar (pentulose or hexulose) kinase